MCGTRETIQAFFHCYVALFFQFYDERDPWEGAGCNPIIMFLTDGGTETPDEVFRKYNWPEKRVSKHYGYLRGVHTLYRKIILQIPGLEQHEKS